jgi:predicted YcjX-like family ATPase
MTRTTNIALTGSARSGKTNFLTSLIWHLDKFNAQNFALKNKKKKQINLSQIELDPDHKSTFNFSSTRSKLVVESQFAQKTQDVSHYTVEFNRSDWYCRQRLQFFDFPGERFADTAMAYLDNYDNWASHQMKMFHDNYTISKEVADYDEAVSTAKDKQECIAAYKDFLFRLYRNYATLISPSVFLLDQQGQHLGTKTQKNPDAYKECLTGIQGHEFCPLPRKITDRNTEIRDSFRENYYRYRKAVVLMTFHRLFSVQKLLIFVDIPSMLMAGSQRLNNEQQIIEDMLKALDRKSSIGKKIYKFLSLGRSVYDIAFIAAKADMVHQNDLNDGKFEKLLKEFTGCMLNNFSFNYEQFACSAVHSTMSDAFPEMIAKLKHPPDGKNLQDKSKYSVTPLPNEWSPTFSCGEYNFPRVLPDVPQTFMFPPKHYNLDKIFNYLID